MLKVAGLGSESQAQPQAQPPSQPGSLGLAGPGSRLYSAAARNWWSSGPGRPAAGPTVGPALSAGAADRDSVSDSPCGRRRACGRPQHNQLSRAI